MTRPEIALFDDVHVVVTTRDDGDQRPLRYQDALSQQTQDPSRAVQIAIAGAPFTFVRQIHGDVAVSIEQAGGALDVEADAIITSATEVPIAVLGADCALVGLASAEGVIGVAHVGWRGLLAGVLDSAVRSMRERGALDIVAVVGPTIGPECYEFSASDLVPIVAEYGERVRGCTREGADALDLLAGIEVACARAGVRACLDLATCTSCDRDYYSWRAARETGRHALAVWRSSHGSEPV